MLTKDLLEVRGTGLINIMQAYGVKSVINGTVISLCVELVDKANLSYDKLDRLGDSEMFYDVLGGKIPKVQVPIKEGASVSSLIEAAVIAFKAKKRRFWCTVIAFIKNYWIREWNRQRRWVWIMQIK